LEAHLAGVYPRSEKLVAATRATVRGTLPQSQVDKILEDDVKSLILLEEQSSLDSFVDGQLNWQDLFRPFSEIFTGIEAATLTRWFDNNTFYRKPIITDKVAFRGNALQQYFRVDLLPKDRRRKAILPGPLTFALMSENKAYLSPADLIDDIAKALQATVRTLQGLGYGQFQFNEPCIASPNRTKSQLETVKQAYQTCAQGKGILQTYFGDVSPVIDILLDLPIEAIGIDFYSTTFETLRGHDFNKTLGCGIIDGRNSLLESPDQLKAIISNVRDQLQPRDVYLTTNCDLEFLPQSVAEKKIRLLGETRRLLNRT
jgi:5-methyltetrahydropteroyltriglutamate--homocysteine methyltransferase